MTRLAGNDPLWLDEPGSGYRSAATEETAVPRHRKKVERGRCWSLTCRSGFCMIRLGEPGPDHPPLASSIAVFATDPDKGVRRYLFDVDRGIEAGPA